MLYRFGPSRRSAQWRWLSVGSVFATLTWLAGSALLSFYLGNYANYDATYGSLGAAIGLMMWMWMSTILVLLGAELNSEIEHQTAVDSTEGGNKPLGRARRQDGRYDRSGESLVFGPAARLENAIGTITLEQPANVPVDPRP